MLLGIGGSHGTGKTTHIHGSLPNLVAESIYPFSLILADNCIEYVNGDHKRNIVWKGARQGKVAMLSDMIRDDSTLYVVEGSWVWRPGALLGDLGLVAQECGGGYEMLYAVADGPTMIRFIKDRCIKVGKAYSTSWDTRAEYESHTRCENAAKKHLLPYNVPYKFYYISYNRLEWDAIDGELWGYMKRPAADWYGG